jgi:hypothetical protein
MPPEDAAEGAVDRMPPITRYPPDEPPPLDELAPELLPEVELVLPLDDEPDPEVELAAAASWASSPAVSACGPSVSSPALASSACPGR